jgi:hypothetical protein
MFKFPFRRSTMLPPLTATANDSAWRPSNSAVEGGNFSDPGV